MDNPPNLWYSISNSTGGRHLHSTTSPPRALDGGPWVYRDSPVMHFDEEAARRFDEGLPPMEKRVLPCQEEFYILSSSVLR